MITNFKTFVQTKGSSLLSPAHGRVGARATSSSFRISVPPPSKKIAGGFQQAGKKKKGCGENEFLPACSVPKARLGWESVSAIPASAGRQNRKIFVSLIEKNFGGRRLKKCRENFSVLLAVRRAETLGGSIGKILWILLKKGSDIVQQAPPY